PVTVTAERDDVWDLWIDTGGTFTDCLARGPDGHLLRTKVLSSSALRGSAVSFVDSLTLQVAPQWKGSAGLTRGFVFQRLDDPAVRSTVAGFDPETGVLSLSSPVSGRPCPFPFELMSPEESPVLAARMITGTDAGDRLPPI